MNTGHTLHAMDQPNNAMIFGGDSLGVSHVSSAFDSLLLAVYPNRYFPEIKENLSRKLRYRSESVLTEHPVISGLC